MYGTDEEKARRDAFNNYKNPFGSPEYNRAHDAARVSHAEGAMVGGLIGGIITIIFIILYYCTVGVALAIKEIFLWMRTLAWEDIKRGAAISARISAAIGAIIIILIAYSFYKVNYAPKTRVERENLFNDIAEKVEMSADFAEETASVRAAEGDNEIRAIWAARRRYVEVLLDRDNPSAGANAWWHIIKDDAALYGKINKKSCHEDKMCLQAARNWSRASIAMLVVPHSYMGRKE